MTKSIFNIPGMDCPVEEKLVRSALKPVAGIVGLRFNLLKRSLCIEHEAESLAEIREALAALNMGATLAEEGVGVPEPAKPDWKKLGVALIFAFLSECIELYAEWGSPSHRALWQFLSIGTALAAIFLPGLGVWKKGLLAIRHFNLNMNALMAVAVTGAVLIGQWPEAAMVMVLFNMSEAIEARALATARDAIGSLVALAPPSATVSGDNGEFIRIPVEEVEVGQRIRVAPGEKIPLDGVVVSGSSTVNQAAITGESMPVDKNPGDFLYGGTLNENGSLEFRCTAAANDTTLARIIHTVEEAQATRAPIQRFVDVFASWYTPAIFILALLLALVAPVCFHVPWLTAIHTSLVVLVIGCPCALVISTPVSIVCALANAAKKGILIKGGVFLEQGRKLKAMALDKTGTLTLGKPVVTDVICLADGKDSDSLQLAASLAARSDHPVSRAIMQYARRRLILPLAVEDFAAVPGAGVKGKVLGQEYGTGNLKMAKTPLGPDVLEKIATLEGEGKTVTALFGPGGILALIAVSDTLRSSAKGAVRDLEKMGLTIAMLTGDNDRAARAIAREVGISQVMADLLPEQKLTAVETLQERYGPVGMVGDGINDAPALARADISFAMAKEGTDTAIETADVALMDDDPKKLPEFIALSRATYRILFENIALALFIKAVFLVLALMGHATMWMAVFADVGAALLVIANGMRLLRFGN